MVLGDFHIHTKFSDGRLTIRQVVDFYGKQGFDAIAITDHLCEEQTFLGGVARTLGRTLTRETFPEYIEEIQVEAERALKRYGMTVIPGFEITKNSFSHNDSAHIVALGIDQWIDADQDIMDVLRDIRNAGGVSVAAHPVPTRKIEAQTFHLWGNRYDLAPYVDVWEVASGPHWFHEVSDSKLPMIANSDMHHPYQMHSWKSMVHSENHPEAILEGIKKQKIEFRFWNYQQRKDSSWL